MSSFAVFMLLVSTVLSDVVWLCSAPDPYNTVLCLKPLPSDMVASCFGRASNDCTSAFAEYTIASFPKQVISAPEGKTKEEPVFCWTRQACFWSIINNRCEAGAAGEIHLGAKIVADLSNPKCTSPEPN